MNAGVSHLESFLAGCNVDVQGSPYPDVVGWKKVEASTMLKRIAIRDVR